MGACTLKAPDIKTRIYTGIRFPECLTVLGAEGDRRIPQNLVNLVTRCLVLFHNHTNCINESALWIEPTAGGKPVIKLAAYMNPSTNSFILLPLNGEKLFFFPFAFGGAKSLCNASI